MKQKHILFFLLAIVIVLVYGLLDPMKFAFPKCPFRVMTGLLCPGCGSQRAMHFMLHGNLKDAFLANPLFIPALLYGAIAFICSTFMPANWPFIRKRYYGLNATYIVLLLIIAFAIGRNIV